MAEHFSFFDAVLQEDGTYDREYNAQQFTKYFGALVTTGVMKGMGNMLAVSANGSNMVTKIDTGLAFVEAKYYENDNFLELTHDTETLGNSRIDRIVVRMDLSTEARYVKAFIKKGVPSTNPVAPTLTQTPNLYEISLAQVKIVGGQTFIATNAVTDERGKDVICPWAGSNILPNFNADGLQELINKVDGLHPLTDGIYLITPETNDCNDLIEAGFYQVSQDSLNTPPKTSSIFKWGIQVMPYYIEGEVGPVVLQVAFNYDNNEVYIRRRARSGLWSAWENKVELKIDEKIKRGTGSPEGKVTAVIGTLYVNSSGGVSTTLYVKTSGSGNTGWTAK